MVSRNLFEMIALCEEACAAITNMNVGSVNAFSTPLNEIMHRELLQFVAYVSMADGEINDEEYELIRRALSYGKFEGTKAFGEAMAGLRFNENYSKTQPISLKYFVLADAGRKIPNDRNRHQNAQILVDTYKLLGQSVIACHGNNAEKETRRFTEYTRMLESFLKEYGVYYVGTGKYITPSYKTGDGPDSTAKALRAPIDRPDTNLNNIINNFVNNLSKNVSGKNQNKGKSEKNGKNDNEGEGVVIKKAPAKEFDVDEVLSELNSYVGLSSVKADVESLVNLIKVQKLRESKGLKTTGISKHMVFMGNPGTGKTTVARILSKIYQGLGVLQTDAFVEVDRGGLVCGYVGQTAIKTQEVIEQAMGGILFIDEAYSLTVDKGANDFGQEAVDTLLKAMADHRDELVVIVAGYQGPMEEFLNSNPGLKSRFNKFLYFEDYTADELVEILENMCKSKEYVLSKAAKTEAKKYFTAKIDAKEDNFANAREARNYLEKAITRHASRVVKLKNPDEKVLTTLEKEDLTGEKVKK